MKQAASQALESAIFDGHSNIAGVVVQQHGAKVYEGYGGGYTAADSLHIFSVTKSVFSILIGIAMDQGFLTGPEQKVLDFFPDYTPKRGEHTLQKIRIEELLTMTAPYKYKSAPYTKYFSSEDWVKTSLDLLGGKGEIGQFRYAPLLGPDILSGILTNATGLSALAFAQQNLFGPLGISVERPIVFHSKEEQIALMMNGKSQNGWVADSQGHHTVGWGLFLTASDMAKIGQLYLDGGMWNGKRLVSAEWIADSTKKHSRCAQFNLDYGYLWWLVGAGCYAAIGDGGNVIYVNPKKDLVVAITALFRPNVTDRIAFIQEQIEPRL